MFQVQHTNLSRSEHEHSFHLTWFSLLACSFCVSRIHSFGHLVAQSKRWDFFFCWFVVRWNAENKESHCFHQNKDGPHLTQETPKEHVTAPAGWAVISSSYRACSFLLAFGGHQSRDLMGHLQCRRHRPPISWVVSLNLC